MKVFISWSKPASRQLGLLLRDWLPEVIQEIAPWMSSEDIEKGQRWASEIGAQLGELGQGILCVTPENLGEPWLNFEAGALAKSLDGARVRPVLLDLHPSEVTGPLAQFQATVANDREDMLKLIKSLNDGCEKPLELSRLERAFERNWDEFAKNLDTARSMLKPGKVQSRRPTDDMIGEVLERVREIQRSLERPEKNVRSSLDAIIRNPQDPVLADGSPARIGMHVFHPDTGVRRITSLVPASRIGTPLAKHLDPDSLVATVPVDDGGMVVIAVPIAELRRPSKDELRRTLESE